MRTTKAELDQLAAMISHEVGEPFTIENAYGRPRLHREGGAIEVSPRLAPSQLAEWMRAYLQGVDDYRRVQRRIWLNKPAGQR